MRKPNDVIELFTGRLAGVASVGAFCAALLLPTGFSGAHAATSSVELLKEMPAKGTLRRGEVVYVDDGTCPAGEVKRLIGGNQKAGAERQVECVKRPPAQ